MLSAIPPTVMPIISPAFMERRLTTAEAGAVGELLEIDNRGTAFFGCAAAEGVILEGSTPSQLRGEVEDELVDGIEDVISGALEPGSDEVLKLMC